MHLPLTLMTTLVAVLVMTVDLGGGFGAAGAIATPTSSGLIAVELTVEVDDGDGPVVAHLILPGESTVTVSMNRAGEGRWTARADVRSGDWQVVFEAAGSGTMSSPVSLTRLGVDSEVLAPGSVPSVPEPPATIRPPWGWLSLATGAAGAALLLTLFSSRSANGRHAR